MEKITGFTRFTLLTCCLISAIVVNAQSDKGWTSLFDGKTLKGWKILGGKAAYSIENGVIVGTTVANTPNTFLTTTKEYGDFILEVDIRVDDTMNNSGIQTRSHFDAAANNGNGRVFGRQIEVDPSSRKWSGGIYDEARRGWLYPLSLNPAAQGQFKLKAYNRFTIECIGNEIKTWVNGKPAAYLVDTIDQKGFIALQVHSVSNEHAGKKIYFKNVRIKTGNIKPAPFAKNVVVVNYQPNMLTAFEKENGYELLFDGKTAAGWRSANGPAFPQKGWRIENGVLTVLASEGHESANGGDIITNEQFGAFDLTFFFRLTPGANSGLKYFVTLQEKTQGSAIGRSHHYMT